MDGAPQIPVGDTLIWRAYGQFVKRLLLGPNNPKEGLDYVYVCPPTEHGLRGGRPIPDAVTNANVSSVADSLQRADSPLFTIHTDLSYFESLDNYLKAVTVKTITQEQKAEIKQAIKEQIEAEEQRNIAKASALAAWKNDSDAQANHRSFQDWAIDNADSYLELEEQVVLASGQVDLLQSKYYGALAGTLREKKEKLEKLAGDTKNSNPGYNMPCFIRDYAIDEAALDADRRVEDIDGRDLVYQPLYTIDGYESSCDSWIKGTAGDGTIVTLDLTSNRYDDWKELGHSESISRRANKFFFFFSKSSSTSTAETHLNFNGSDWKQQTKITLYMAGPAQVFNITPGLWDDSGVRRTFPNLLEGETDTALGLVRVSKILVGYEVSLKIRFAESLKTQVRNMVSQAQSESNGGLRIFGFQFGPDQASGTSFTRDVNSVKYNETANEMSLPASPRGCPVILGILGRKIGA
ncbi:hypothetical protein P875_00021533 [Aspergillus parasiticus SU-1]|uniref:Uncharacterized protein n=2 Tax=Aspergillus parasiticus TaxID=5067 RepID=A0A5N6DX11_ASPPA|nr:hypothetical protein BDV34DRAFT_221515 [Aspergillus parasiticus]KJK66334.1 hypothetical protein P875_00021533 [Aspergillus parasiticus SU-1]